MKPESLPSGHRWLLVSPVVRLEGQGCRALGVGSLERGVCDSLSHASPSFSDFHHPGFVLSPVCQGDSFGRGDSGSSPQGSGGACASDSGFLRPHVCCDQGYGRLAADHRPLNSEPERGSDSFSDGDISDGSACYRQERLDGLHRSEGCVPSDSDPPWQFRVLCFGLSTAPQVFTHVMAPVSWFLHQLGIRMLRYLDDWLILASSKEEACWARDKVLSLCQELGIVVNLEKSTLTPSQTIVYLGIRIDSQTFRASVTPSRIEKFFSIAEEFLTSKVKSVKFWRVLLGHLASLSRFVPNGQLRMRAL